MYCTTQKSIHHWSLCFPKEVIKQPYWNFCTSFFSSTSVFTHHWDCRLSFGTDLGQNQPDTFSSHVQTFRKNQFHSFPIHVQVFCYLPACRSTIIYHHFILFFFFTYGSVLETARQPDISSSLLPSKIAYVTLKPLSLVHKIAVTFRNVTGLLLHH
jgi:hypothetical protein